MEELANTGKNVTWLLETGIDPGGYQGSSPWFSQKKTIPMNEFPAYSNHGSKMLKKSDF